MLAILVDAAVDRRRRGLVIGLDVDTACNARCAHDDVEVCAFGQRGAVRAKVPRHGARFAHLSRRRRLDREEGDQHSRALVILEPETP